MKLVFVLLFIVGQGFAYDPPAEKDKSVEKVVKQQPVSNESTPSTANGTTDSAETSLPAAKDNERANAKAVGAAMLADEGKLQVLDEVPNLRPFVDVKRVQERVLSAE